MTRDAERRLAQQLVTRMYRLFRLMAKPTARVYLNGVIQTNALAEDSVRVGPFRVRRRIIDERLAAYELRHGQEMMIFDAPARETVKFFAMSPDSCQRLLDAIDRALVLEDLAQIAPARI